jgi:putative flippase GtrA
MQLPPPLDRYHARLAQAWEDRAVSLKALSFALVGIVNTLIDLGIFLIAYNGFSLPLVPANILAWIVAVSCSYVMNSFITFAAESGGKLRWRSYGTFLVSGVAGVIVNTSVLVVASFWIPVLAAKLLAILASFVVNFSLSHFVVFRTRTPQPGTPTE